MKKIIMSTMLIAAIVMSALAVVASTAGGVGSLMSQKKQNETNLQQYEDWKAYNTPSAQMERLEDAGLNKYLVSNVQNQLSQPFQAGQENVGDVFQGLATGLQNGGNTMLNYYDKALNRDVRIGELENKRDLTEIRSKEFSIREQLAQLALDKGDYELALLALQVDNNELNNTWLSETLQNRIDLSSENLRKVRSAADLNEANADYVRKKIDSYDDMIRSQIASNYSNVNYRQNYIDYLDSQLLFSKDKFFTQHYTLSEWQLQQINNWLTRNGISRDYYNLADKKVFWNLMFGGINAVSGAVRSVGSLVK